MTEKDFEEIEYQKKMAEHRKKMEIRKEKRRKEKRIHILLFFLLLLLLFLTFVGIRFALPYWKNKELSGIKKESSPAWEKEIQSLSSDSELEKSGNSEKNTESVLSEKEEALKTAELKAKQYDYDGAVATLQALNTPEDSEV